MTWFRLGAAVAAVAVGGSAWWLAGGADPPAKKASVPNDAELVERVVAARKEYQASLIAMYEHYSKVQDKERAKWAEEELKAHHLAWKPSYRLDILDVPPANLEAKVNVKEANELVKMAMDYKDKGYGTDYTLNQRRAELLFQEVLQKYPNSDKIADVAYELGDLYEGKAFRQFDRAAAYFERAYQWRKGGRTDALIRAARLYDKPLNERGKAVELYRLVIDTDTDPTRIKEATRRRDELTGGRNNP
jgi:tetratricopeptide (TPR) repeat protein